MFFKALENHKIELVAYVNTFKNMMDVNKCIYIHKCITESILFEA